MTPPRSIAPSCAAASIPIARRLAIDVFAAIDLTQETHVERDSPVAALPREPRALIRFGAGVRFGGL